MEFAVWKRRTRRLSVLVSAMPFGLVTLAVPAQADDWPGPGRLKPDKGDHYYCMSDVAPPTANVEDRIHASMQYLEDLNIGPAAPEEACDTVGTGTGRTDVAWREERVYGTDGGELIGKMGCLYQRPSPNTDRCDMNIATVNGSLIRAYYPASQPDYRLTQFRKTSCHELGHTLGLTHYETPGDRYGTGESTLYRLSCQRLGWTGHITDPWYRTWESHHIDHIDGWFS